MRGLRGGDPAARLAAATRALASAGAAARPRALLARAAALARLGDARRAEEELTAAMERGAPLGRGGGGGGAAMAEVRLTNNHAAGAPPKSHAAGLGRGAVFKGGVSALLGYIPGTHDRRAVPSVTCQASGNRRAV